MWVGAQHMFQCQESYFFFHIIALIIGTFCPVVEFDVSILLGVTQIPNKKIKKKKYSKYIYMLNLLKYSNLVQLHCYFPALVNESNQWQMQKCLWLIFISSPRNMASVQYSFCSVWVSFSLHWCLSAPEQLRYCNDYPKIPFSVTHRCMEGNQINMQRVNSTRVCRFTHKETPISGVSHYEPMHFTVNKMLN